METFNKTYRNLKCLCINFNIQLIKTQLALILLILIGINSYSQTSINYTVYPTDRDYYFYQDQYNSYYGQYTFTSKLGYENDSVFHYTEKTRNGLLFNCGEIPTYATITSSYFKYTSSSVLKGATSYGGVSIRGISNSFLQSSNETVFGDIGSANQIASQTVSSADNYSLESSSLKQLIQNAVEGSNHNLGIGVKNLQEDSGKGFFISNIRIEGVFTIPTPKAATALIISNLNAESCTLSWNAPTVSGGSGPATGYDVKIGSNFYCYTTNTSVSISGLCPGEQVALRIIAKNEYGDGPTAQVLCEPPSVEVAGDLFLCSNKTNYYDVNNLPSDGTITWSNSQNISRVSNQGSNPCLFQPNGHGAGIIIINISSQSCGTYCDTISVWVDYPSAPTVYPASPIYVPINNTFSVNIVNSPGAYPSSGFWEVNGCVTINGSDLGDGASFYSASSDGNGTIYVSTSNECGGYYYKTAISVITGSGGNCGEEEEEENFALPLLILSPNPAKEYVDLAITQLHDEIDQKITIDILDLYSKLVKRLFINDKLIRIPVTDLNPGTYFINVRTKTTNLHGTLVIQK